MVIARTGRRRAGRRSAPARGHYESYYLRAGRSGAPARRLDPVHRHVAPGGRPSGQLWFTYFDRDAPRPRAVRVDVGEPTHRRRARGSGSGTSGSGRRGSPGRPTPSQRSATRTLSSHSTSAPLGGTSARELDVPRAAPAARSCSPVSRRAVFDGTGAWTARRSTRRLDRAWSGTTGRAARATAGSGCHGWGSRATAPTPGSTWRSAGSRLGPVTTPRSANGALSLDGERYVPRRRSGGGRPWSPRTTTACCELPGHARRR